jgi:hypothetical protein
VGAAFFGGAAVHVVCGFLIPPELIGGRRLLNDLAAVAQWPIPFLTSPRRYRRFHCRRHHRDRLERGRLMLLSALGDDDLSLTTYSVNSVNSVSLSKRGR